ncbi:MAG: zinc transporter ZntB [Alphaproteobacteria bacterium]|nr:zinc transporter ZntB [Alphaproteobacteria bacterium]
MSDVDGNGRTTTIDIPEVLAFSFDPHGTPAPLDIDAIHPDTAVQQGFRWVHVRRDVADAQGILQRCGLDSFVIEALTAEETRPRCSLHANGAILILRGVNLNPGAEPEDMVSVRLWIEGHQVVGVWVRPLTAVADLLETLRQGRGPVSPGDLVAKLTARLIDRVEPVVASLNERIDGMEETVLTAVTAALRVELTKVRRTSILLRRYMFPQRDALTTLEIEDLPWLQETDRHRIREAGNRVTRLAEELDAIRERATIIYDEIMNRQSEAMNRHMLTLSIVAAIFLPLSLLTGLLGINVGGIPGGDSPWGFTLVTVALLILGGLQYWAIRKMKLF